MKRSALIVFAGLAMLLLTSIAWVSKLKHDLKSQDDQIRANAFFTVFSSYGRILRHCLVDGRSRKEIHQLLGTPTHIATLRIHGRSFLLISYEQKVFPRGQNEGAGMMYGPSVYFDERRAITWHELQKAVRMPQHLAATPEQYRFKVGGDFP